jgi:hypothetical protein
MTGEVAANVVAPSHQANNDEDDEANNAQPASAAKATSATGRAASILYVVTQSTGRPIHLLLQ